MEPLELREADNGTHCQELLQFCKNTNIHGVKYLAEKKLSRVKRSVWLLVLIASTILCCYWLYQAVDKWRSAPIIFTSDETKPLFSWDEPFPAITVCSQIKIRQRVYNFTKDSYRLFKGQEIDQLGKQKLNDACLACHESLCDTFGNKDTSESSIDFILKVAPPFEQVILTGVSEVYSSKILTEEGICYSVNLLDLSQLYTKNVVQSNHAYLNTSTLRLANWTQENGYPHGEQVDTYPKRALVTSLYDQDGIDLTLVSLNDDYDHLCTPFQKGFKVFIHNPAEAPQSGKHVKLHVEVDQKVTVSVLPKKKTTSDALRNLSPSKRGCFYPEERKLDYFQVYTATNCELECVTKYTSDLCGCVPYHLPRIKHMPICNADKKASCYKRYPIAKQYYTFHHSSQYIPDNNPNRVDYPHYREIKKSVNRSLDIDCQCLPSCTSLEYSLVGKETAAMDWKTLVRVHPEYSKMLDRLKDSTKSISISSVNVKISDITFIPKQRSEAFGAIDFFAYCGGFLALCLGVSIISLVEVVYCASSCLYHIVRNRKGQQSSN